MCHVGNGDKPRFSSLFGILPPTLPYLVNLSSTTSRRARNRIMSQDPSFVTKFLHNPNSWGRNNIVYHNRLCCNNTALPEPIKNHSEILTWLSPLEPRLRHSDLQSNRAINVGDWLLRTEEFLSWKSCNGQGESQKATIFCSGNPGVGKTHIR